MRSAAFSSVDLLAMSARLGYGKDDDQEESEYDWRSNYAPHILFLTFCCVFLGTSWIMNEDNRPAQAAPPVRLRRRNELPPDLATLSVRELKALARERRLNIDYPMEKSELVAKIEATFR